MLLKMALKIVLAVESPQASEARGGDECASPDLGEESILALVHGLPVPSEVVAVSEALRTAWGCAVMRSDVGDSVVSVGFRPGCEHPIASRIGAGKGGFLVGLGCWVKDDVGLGLSIRGAGSRV